MSDWNWDDPTQSGAFLALGRSTAEGMSEAIRRWQQEHAARAFLAALLGVAGLDGLAQALREFGGAWFRVAFNRLSRPGWARCSQRRLGRPVIIEELRRELALRLDQEDKVLLALHIGCGALALGMDRVEPLHEDEEG